MGKLKRVLFTGVVLSAIAPAGAVLAQQAPAAKAPDTVAEVVVTAQKREQKLQQVPLSVTVVGQAQLSQQQITDTEDLVRAVPALTTYGEPGNSGTRYSLRGINTQSFSISSEQAVSFVLDGVVLGRAPAVSLFDVSRIEVLSGPQGTLFGKNASGGVINIVTNAPELGRFDGAVHADFGDRWDYRVLDGVVNVPVGQTAALRISAGENYDSGFLDNPVRHQESVDRLDNVRARFLWEPTSDITVNLIADYEKQNITDQVYVQFGTYDSTATGKPIPIPGCGPGAGVVINANSRVDCGGDPDYLNNSDYGYSAQIDWRVAGHTVTSITSYRRYFEDGALDVDGLPTFAFDNGNLFNNKVLTQELRIASPTGGVLDYVAGGYFSRTDVYNYLTQALGPGAGVAPYLSPYSNPNIASSSTDDYALFGQATVHPTDKLSLIAGARLTRDVVDMQALAEASFGSIVPLTPLGPTVRASDTVNNFSWKLGAQYQFDKDLMVYATATHGYKGPQIQFNPPNALLILASLPPGNATLSIIKPELPMAYEVGAKSTLFNGRLALDGDLFYTRIKDFQTELFNPATDIPVASNAPWVDTEGVEIDFFGRPTHDLNLSGGLIYNIATYGPLYSSNEDGASVNVRGHQIAGAPRWKVNLAAEYSHDLGDNLQGFISADLVYTSSVDFAEYSDPLQTVPGHAIVGARLGVRSPDKRWSIAVFARNLFDDRAPVFLYAPYLLANTTAPGVTAVGRSYSTDSFRLVGVTLDGRF